MARIKRTVSLAPAALVAGLAALPVAYLAIRASGAGSAAWSRFATLETLALLGRSAGLAAAVSAAAICVAVPFAWLTTCTNLPFRRTWAVLGALPLVIPSYVGALTLISAFGPRGLLQGLLEGPLGISRIPEIYGFWGAFAALTMFTYPYVLLTTIAALRRFDFAQIDVARSLGAGRLRAFTRAGLPQVRSAVSSGGLLCALYALSDFGVVSLMRFDSFTRAIYVHYRSLYDRNGAALLSLALVGLTIFVVGSELRLRGDRARHGSVTVSARRMELGRWRAPAVCFVGSIVALTLAVPFAVLIYWVARSLDRSPDLAALGAATIGSITASGLAAAAAAALALPIAVVTTRRRGGRPQRVIEVVTTAGFALPGIVVALGLVFFAVRYAPWIYQTLPLLVTAYVIRFLPQAMTATRSALARSREELENVARSLGEGSRGVFLRVTLPLAWPGVASGALLVFLTSMKELPATLILRPLGFDTLAIEIWTKSTSGSYAAAAIPALLLIAISAIPLYVLGAREGFRDHGG